MGMNPSTPLPSTLNLVSKAKTFSDDATLSKTQSHLINGVTIEICYVVTGCRGAYNFYIIKCGNYAAIIDSGDRGCNWKVHNIVKRYLLDCDYIEYFETHNDLDHYYYRGFITELVERKNGHVYIRPKGEFDSFVSYCCEKERGFEWVDAFSSRCGNNCVLSRPSSKSPIPCPFDIKLFIPSPHASENANSILVFFSHPLSVQSKSSSSSTSSYSYPSGNPTIQTPIISSPLSPSVSHRIHQEPISSSMPSPHPSLLSPVPSVSIPSVPSTQPFTAFFTGDMVYYTADRLNTMTFFGKDFLSRHGVSSSIFLTAPHHGSKRYSHEFFSLCVSGRVLSVPSGGSLSSKKKDNFSLQWDTYGRREWIIAMRNRGAHELISILKQLNVMKIIEDSIVHMDLDGQISLDEKETEIAATCSSACCCSPSSPSSSSPSSSSSSSLHSPCSICDPSLIKTIIHCLAHVPALAYVHNTNETCLTPRLYSFVQAFMSVSRADPTKYLEDISLVLEYFDSALCRYEKLIEKFITGKKPDEKDTKETGKEKETEKEKEKKIAIFDESDDSEEEEEVHKKEESDGIIGDLKERKDQTITQQHTKPLCETDLDGYDKKQSIERAEEEGEGDVAASKESSTQIDQDTSSSSLPAVKSLDDDAEKNDPE
ncbi:hypothetical protein ADUPG1_010114, partial [Aduncisulcus paluster]